MATIIDGKKIAEKVVLEIKRELNDLSSRKITPTLAVVLVGSDPASQVYVTSKDKKALELGIESQVIRLPETTKEKELLDVVKKLNSDKKINAILVQFPLPRQISERRVRDSISPQKDVDGLNSENIGKLINGDETLAPCTPKGVIRLLDEFGTVYEGRHAVVVGRSLLVGKPIANMLLNRNCTITNCHSKTRNLGELTRLADILIVAVGKPRLISKSMVKKGAIVIDVGMNRISGGTIKEDVSQKEKSKLVGDVDFEFVSKIAKAITPVPGGVGPMTIAMLMQNTVNCAKIQNGIIK